MRKLTVLGCGDAFSSGGRYNTSFLVEDDQEAFLMDCGATTLTRLKQLQYPLEKIRNIFITHFHGDHYGGLPFFIISHAFQIRSKTELNIWGPPGIEKMTRNLQDAMYPETSELLDSLPINFIEYNGSWQTASSLEIRAIEVKHSPPSFPHGLNCRWGGKILAFSGDTEWTEGLPKLADDTELLILECNNYANEPPGHLSYQTIIDNNGSLKTRKLLLTHMGNDVLMREDLSFDKLRDGQVIELW